MVPKKPIRPIRVEGDIAYVTLTKGKEAVIDAADVPLVDGYSWFVSLIQGHWYAMTNIRTGDKKRTIYMHREINQTPAGMLCDHRDRNGLNNRRHNLRRATYSQNRQNSKINSNSSSEIKGVSPSRGGKWVAKITLHRKPIHLGTFDTPEGARKAYCEASKRLHGEFGRTE